MPIQMAETRATAVARAMPCSTLLSQKESRQRRFADMGVGSVNQCVFCGRTGLKLTKEDVIPLWMWRAFNDAGLTGAVTLSVNGRKARSAARMPVRFGDVCSQCNSGWMNDLESAVRPFIARTITGFRRRPERAIQLDETAQRSLATWALKTWLLWSPAMHYVMHSSVRSPGGFAWLYEHRVPPPTGFYAYIATLVHPVGEVLGMNVTRATRQTTESTDAHAILTLMSFGALGLALILPEEDPGIVALPDAVARTYLVQIWPTESPIVEWPVARQLTPELIDHLFPAAGITYQE